MANLLRLYTGNGEYLSPQAPKTQGAHDDASSMAALAYLGALERRCMAFRTFG